MCFLGRSATRRPPPFAHFAKGRGAASRLGSSCVKIRVSVSAKNTTKTRDFCVPGGVDSDPDGMRRIFARVGANLTCFPVQLARPFRGGATGGLGRENTGVLAHRAPRRCFCGKSSIPGGHLSSGAWGVGLTRENASDWRPQLRGAVAKRWISFEVPCFAMVRRVRWCENDVFLLPTSLHG